MSYKIIKKDGRPEWAVIPYEDYQRLVIAAEKLQNIQDYDEVRFAPSGDDQNPIPREVAYALLNQDTPIRAWRNYRGLSQKQLAKEAGTQLLICRSLRQGSLKAPSPS
jgi:hypothetical protein